MTGSDENSAQQKIPESGRAPTAPAGRPAPPQSPFGQVPIEITISVGRARPLIRDLMALSKDSVLVLDRQIDDPVELFAGDRLIARGTLQELEGDEAGQLAVRLTEVGDLQNGL